MAELVQSYEGHLETFGLSSSVRGIEKKSDKKMIDRDQKKLKETLNA